ncbi:MAG: tRNA lysidine(34) synthetase TilS [candidate division WOR-3 bacterium]
MKSLKNFEIPEEVFEAIESFDLIEKKDRILISYSGGPDSTFLTYVLLNLKKKFFLEISLFYLFHKLEGSLPPEKARDFASNLGLKIFIFEEDIKKFAKDNKLNIEEAGRVKRYTLLSEVSEKEGFNKIATAHTLNDALETFLLRFLREGFSLLNPPIKPKYKKLIRPLILIPRDKIIKILKNNDISYHIDIENYTLQRTRNKIRHILIPEIFREFNFSLSKFKKFYIRIIEESNFYEENIKKEIKEYVEEKTPFFMRINREKIIASSSFKKRELLKNILFEFGFEEELKREMLLNIEEILDKGGKIEIKKDLFFVSKGDYVLFMKKIPNFEIPLREGEYEIIKGLRVKVEKNDKEGFLPLYLLNEAKLRFRKPCDLIDIEGKKDLKLKKFFENKKVPFYLRDYILVLEYKGKIVWIEGFKPFIKGKDLKIEVLKWK